MPAQVNSEGRDRGGGAPGAGWRRGGQPRAHLWISRVCTPYLLSTRYLPGSAAWLSRHPSLYLDGETLPSGQRRPGAACAPPSPTAFPSVPCCLHRPHCPCHRSERGAGGRTPRARREERLQNSNGLGPPRPGTLCAPGPLGTQLEFRVCQSFHKKHKWSQRRLGPSPPGHGVAGTCRGHAGGSPHPDPAWRKLASSSPPGQQDMCPPSPRVVALSPPACLRAAQHWGAISLICH